MSVLIRYNAPTSGTTAQRPAPVKVGQRYFDTTLQQPVWAQQITPSVVWVNAAGAPA